VRPSSPEKSDRLNTDLNIRLAEYDALRMYGGVPAWNPIMFGGFSVAALHWMKSRHRPALCYGLSVLGVHRIAQVDNAYLTLVLLPAAMLAIRRIWAGNLIRPFVGLTLSISALAFWGFL
jgi:hypothetical protein